jgi:hypothetical protein
MYYLASIKRAKELEQNLICFCWFWCFPPYIIWWWRRAGLHHGIMCGRAISIPTGPSCKFHNKGMIIWSWDNHSRRFDVSSCMYKKD